MYFEYDAQKISLRDENINNMELAYILYHIDNECILFVDGIEKNSISDIHYQNVHFGTDILNKLLLHLQEQGYILSAIRGKLSSADAYNGNWLISIPFYYNFPKYKNVKLSYDLKFFIYEDKDCNVKANLYADEDRTFSTAILEENTRIAVEQNKNYYFEYKIIR